MRRREATGEAVQTDQRWVRLLGIAGTPGGLMLFTGDMLFYYTTDSADLLSTMGNCSDSRIIAGGVTALLATWLYVLGARQVRYAFDTTTGLARNTVVACFVAIFIAYGIVHGAHVAIAATAKLAVEHRFDIDAATSLAVRANDALRLFIYPLFAVLSVVFIAQVWQRKTRYPRWMILFFPLFPFLLQGVFDRLLSGTAWIVVIGGFFNLILVLFFAASTVALWNRSVEPAG